MENIEKAKENIKEALYGIYVEGKDDKKVVWTIKWKLYSLWQTN